jgi:hypothetical protein
MLVILLSLIDISLDNGPQYAVFSNKEDAIDSVFKALAVVTLQA